MKLQLINALLLSLALSPAVLAYSAPNAEMRMERRAPLGNWFPSPSQQDHPPMYPSGGWTPASTSPAHSPALSRQSSGGSARSGGSSSGSDRNFLQGQAGWQNFAALQLSDPESPPRSSGPSSPVRSASPSPPRRQDWERQTPSPSTGGATPYFGGRTPQSSPESEAGTSRQSGKKKGAFSKMKSLWGKGKKH